MDPMLVLERKQERELRRREQSERARKERDEKEFYALFGGESMARRLGIPPHIESALYQWGKWANRPQFWQNLNATPFYKLMGIGSGRPMSDIRLDPQSLKMHRAFLGMRCRVTKLVLIGYYVAGENWDSKQGIYEMHGIYSREYFNTILKRGSLSLYNAAKVHEDN